MGQGIKTTNLLLARGIEKEWDLIFAAEAWEGKHGERNTQQGYRAFYHPGSKLTLYMRDKADLHQLGAKIEVNEDWIAVGDLVIGFYLSSSINIQTLKDLLTDIPTTDNIIRDLNCTQQHERRAVLKTMRDRGLYEKPAKSNNWRTWHQLQHR